MAGPIIEKQTNRLVSRDEIEVSLLCVPRDALLSDPSTDGCGFRGRGKAWQERVENRNEGDLIPAYENTYVVYENPESGESTDLSCPDCGHELTPLFGESARTTRRRNLREVPDEASQAA